MIDEQHPSSPPLMVRLIADAKRASARQVAALFEEDDTRLFDNRRPMSHLVEFLKDRRNFTAIVNGLRSRAA